MLIKLPCLLFNRKLLDTKIKWNILTLLGAFILLLTLILLNTVTRNHLQKHFPPPLPAVPEKEAPLCTGNLLDKREHRYAKKADGSYDNSRMVSKSGVCHLMRYTFAQAVGCFDALNERHQLAQNLSNNLNHINKSKKRLHFAFVGDSRIRQQFYNFLKLIPAYDQMAEPSPLPSIYHADMEVISKLLGLRITFHWQPYLDDMVIELSRMWANDDETDPPELLVLSMASWHMREPNSVNYHLFQKKLKELAPILDQLANVSQIIWLNQFPTVEYYGNITDLNTEVHSEKLHHYNLAVRRILGNHKSVRIWDSSNLLAEEYVRGCSLSHRITFTETSNSFVHCKDFSHVGYIALSQSTQLLFNDICNDRKMYP